MKGKKIVLAGGTGFIGQALAEAWAADNDVVVLTRNANTGVNNAYGQTGRIADARYVQWNAKTIGAWAAELEGCDILINLAGRSVNCRYNNANKAGILNSRLDAVAVLGNAIGQAKYAPKLFINAASATIYRHAEDRPQDEVNGEIGEGFSVDVCTSWEAAFDAQQLPQTRKVLLRMAIVLGKGSVLIPYSFLARVGLGGKHGNGRQMFSWIHIDDVRGIIDWLDEHKEQSGTYNAAAPGPVSNTVFMRMLRDIYKMPVGIPAPAWLLEIAAFIHRTETELLLKSRWVIPGRLHNAGYTFTWPGLNAALKNLIGK